MDSRERLPRPGTGWSEVRDTTGVRDGDPNVLSRSLWTDGRLLVVSALNLAELPGSSGENGPQWHVSVSRGGGKRAKPHEVRRALRAFGMVEAEEDNHEPGAARHFWLPVDPARRGICECKTSEEQVTTDGHRWSNPREPGACRGCDYERLFGKPCPLHSLQQREAL